MNRVAADGRHVSTAASAAEGEGVVALAVLDSDLRYVTANAPWREAFALPAGGGLSGRPFQSDAAAGQLHWQSVLEQGLAGREVRGSDALPLGPGGAEVPAQWSVQPWRRGDGRVGGVVLGAQRAAGAAPHALLPDPQQVLAGVIASSLDGVYVLEAVRNGAGEIVDFAWLLANPRSEELTARAPEKLIGKRLLEEFPGVRASGVFERYVSAVETGVPSRSEFYYDADGVQGWFLQTIVRLGDGCSVSFHDVTERKRAEARLRASEERYRKLVEQAADIIYRADAEGFFTYANRVAVRCTGYPREEVIGMHFLSLVRPDYRERAITLYQRQIAERLATTYFEFPLRTRAGETRWIGQNVKLIEEDGQALGVQAVARDITERVRAERALEQANEELRQRNQELQEFAYIASHDLQEPLRKVRTFAGLMLEDYADAVDEAGRYYLDRISDGAERMSTLISDLLSFSRITTQARSFEAVDLGAVAAEVCSDLELRIEETSGRVEVGPLPTLEADATQMRQLLQNLIGNALKFHRPGVPPVVEVHAEAWPTEGVAPEQNPLGKPACRLVVRDNGIGFEEKYLDRIFTPFQQLRPRHEYGGTGIGLAICQRIAERHGGAITATSTPGQGSRFAIVLPLSQKNRGPDAQA